MKISLLVVLVVAFLLVSDSEQGWFRRAVRRVGRFTRFVRRHERLLRYGMLAARLGKRSADNPPQPPSDDDDDMDQATAIKKLQELQLACTNFGINGQKLSKETVMEAFDKVDADNDNALDQAELDEFEDVLDAYEACAEEVDTKQG